MSKRLTTEEFIERAKEVHGDKYDYSKVNYVNSSTKVCIICPIHGEFWQIPSDHLSGKGCKKCSYIKTSNRLLKSTDSFISAARKTHGDKYDYGNVVYKGVKEKVEIICKEHGSFWQEADAHIRGQGCPICGGRFKYTNELFIAKAKEKHGNKYDYSKVNYINAHTKVCIICPEHGEFYQSPDAHLRGQGCPICGAITRSLKNKKSFEYFLSKSKEVHGNKYLYDESSFVGMCSKVRIICPEHGEFWQLPSNHMKGCGCPLCGQKSSADTKRSSKEEFVFKSNIIHYHKYDYSNVEYINNVTKVEIICPNHGSFWIKPIKHLIGHGCPMCRASHGEMAVKNWLDNNNIEYKRQFRLNIDERLFSRNKIRVDFYLPQFNTVIEFHGIQHYEYQSFFHRDEDAFGRQVDRDKRLRQYCKQHKINLIEIKYDQIDNIDKILNKKLKIKNK